MVTLGSCISFKYREIAIFGPGTIERFTVFGFYIIQKANNLTFPSFSIDPNQRWPNLTYFLRCFTLFSKNPANTEKCFWLVKYFSDYWFRFHFSLWKDNPAMKIYKKFRLIVSYMTMILVCGNYWTILSSLGIWKCGIWNWNRPKSHIVRQGRNGIRRRIGQNSNNSTDINTEMSSIRWILK